MAISFKDKIAYVNKFADKSDEKLQKVIKLSVNIESPKLNLTDAQKDKIKSSLQTAFERIKKIEDEKGASKGAGKKLKNPNLLQLAKQIKQKQGITFEEARTKAKKAFAAKKSGQKNAIQDVLQDFKKKVGKIEYSRATTYVSKGVTRSTDIKRDMERPALKAGKRKVTTQGSTTNAYGTFKNKVGKVYYESRANRMDVNQPSKKRYPKLAKGAKIYSSDNAYKVQVMVDDKIVDEKIVRARNQREANMLAEEMDNIFTKKYGDHRVKVIEAMGDGGEFGGGGALKGSNPSTGEKFGVVVGSLEKEDGKTTLVIRSAYSSRIKSYELRFDEKGFLSAIGDFGSSTDGSYPDMNKGRLSVSNVDADNKKESIEAISKITSPSFAKKVYDYVQEEKMAEGGLTQHGLKTGDTIMDDMFWEDSIVVKNEKSGTRAKVNLNTGERKEAKMAYGGKMKYNRKK